MNTLKKTDIQQNFCSHILENMRILILREIAVSVGNFIVFGIVRRNPFCTISSSIVLLKV